MINKSLVALSAVLMLTGCSQDNAAEDASAAKAPATVATVATESGIDLTGMDPAVRAQDDFYRYVNGEWLERTSIPADKSNYGMFTRLADEAEENLRRIIEEAAAADAAAGTDTQKVGDFYRSFMDEARIEALGMAPIEPMLEEIAAIDSYRGVMERLAWNAVHGVETPVSPYINPDSKNSTEYIIYLWQSGLGLPDRDYYLSSEQKFADLRAAYRDHIVETLALTGHAEPGVAADAIMAIETKLAEAQWTRVDNRDDNKTYNKYAVADLEAAMAGFDWQGYLAAGGVGGVDSVVVSQPSFFESFAGDFEAVPLADWKAYLAFHTVRRFAPLLSSAFVESNFEFFRKTLRGIEQDRPRWKRAVSAVETSLGEVVGKLYVERHFKPEAKQRMETLVDNLVRAFEVGIDGLDWMSPETKQQAHEKLSKFTVKIGYPDEWKDYSALEVSADDLVGNVLRSSRLEHERAIAKLGGPIDRDEWFMTPQTVNAYYNPNMNEIVFPAAILQPPFFNMDADDAVNYGAIGAVIGHEISHGFDDSGADYDGDGNLRNWWSEDDLEEFNARGAALAAQFDRFEPLEGMHVNGKLTLGENIGDLSGLTVAYNAYRLSLGDQSAPVIDGFTGPQRFFMGWAQIWRRKYREQELLNRLKTDPHSPSEYRVNGVVPNMPEFYQAFGVKPGDDMYLPPEDRVKLW
ncbi:MAG: M13-type metalloendopeptidase [Gammaproteobacteria bacterium]|nr:M13-type metalloendopeptidase [Gammaproteobacteria bacterium]